MRALCFSVGYSRMATTRDYSQERRSGPREYSSLDRTRDSTPSRRLTTLPPPSPASTRDSATRARSTLPPPSPSHRVRDYSAGRGRTDYRTTAASASRSSSLEFSTGRRRSREFSLGGDFLASSPTTSTRDFSSGVSRPTTVQQQLQGSEQRERFYTTGTEKH